MVLGIIGTSVLTTALLIFIKPLAAFFQFEPLSILELSVSVFTGFVFVIWFEIYKWVKRSDSAVGVGDTDIIHS